MLKVNKIAWEQHSLLSLNDILLTSIDIVLAVKKVDMRVHTSEYYFQKLSFTVIMMDNQV